MRKSTLSLLGGMVLVLCQCTSAQVPDSGSSSSWFISTFYDASSLSLEDNPSPLPFDEDRGGTVMKLSIEGERLQDVETVREQIGDKGGHYSSVVGPISAFINDFDAITVTSDSQFNSYAPGEKLNDIIMLDAASSYPILQRKEGSDYYHFVKPLSSLTSSDLYLLAKDVFLLFTQLPEAKKHNISVVFKEGEKEFGTTGTIVFK